MADLPDIQDMDAAAFEDGILAEVEALRTSDPMKYAQRPVNLYRWLESMEQRLGGTPEQRINRAAIALTGGTERFMKQFGRVPQCLSCCAPHLLRKMTALSMIAGTVDPAYLSENPPTHPPHEPHRPWRAAVRESTAEKEASLFVLGAMYRSQDEDNPLSPFIEASWNIATQADDPRLIRWYHVFFQHPPVRFREAA